MLAKDDYFFDLNNESEKEKIKKYHLLSTIIMYANVGGFGMKVSKKEFNEIMDYSEFLEYYLQKFEKGMTLEGFSDSEIDILRDAVKHDFRGEILISIKYSFFRNKVIIPQKNEQEYLLLKKLCSFFKSVSESSFKYINYTI
ncbi:hypothetical protein [Enterococcus casseliflavus]|uniref:Uncharacterized protein n=2 Tax=Enterococcus casseliflavus TaxID=37734 RepID=A0ABD5FIE1_ENTCA|nr:hypothetical protein [Enterococcus casseliflavus]MDT2982040.1 hypothetical protein [Enterococcus casseliflavus]